MSQELGMISIRLDQELWLLVAEEELDLQDNLNRTTKVELVETLLVEILLLYLVNLLA